MTQVHQLPMRKEGSDISLAIEKALIEGDLSSLTVEERISYYHKTCESLGLNPLTKPFDYIRLNNKLTLYAKKDCADQLRNIHKISCEIKSREKIADLYIVTAKVIAPTGRTDESTGVVNIAGLKGEALANACMKAETKAKRRATLSICGLGFLDESEIENIAGAVKVTQEYMPSSGDEEPKKIADRGDAQQQPDNNDPFDLKYDKNKSQMKSAFFKFLTKNNINETYYEQLSDEMDGRVYNQTEIFKLLKANNL